MSYADRLPCVNVEPPYSLGRGEPENLSVQKEGIVQESSFRQRKYAFGSLCGWVYDADAVLGAGDVQLAVFMSEDTFDFIVGKEISGGVFSLTGTTSVMRLSVW